jgi:hypothetical protein
MASSRGCINYFMSECYHSHKMQTPVAKHDFDSRSIWISPLTRLRFVWPENRSSIPGRGSVVFPPTEFRTLPEPTRPPIPCETLDRVSFFETKWPECKDDKSRPSNTDVKRACSQTYTHSHSLPPAPTPCTRLHYVVLTQTLFHVALSLCKT